ncbi:hypothetical protein [Deinococcus marmoris]|uniref:hypothetical protein n=1 Tax=Deinococcus marmoris TaxID=249408 RepID=UPI00049741FB|nr:hypothetical protein [Deinococcus marmoris]
MSLLTDFQVLARPELDFIFSELGQTVTLYAQQEAVSTGQPGQEPPEYDENGELITPPVTDPTPDTPGAAELGTFPCYFAQLEVQDRAKLAVGGDLSIPLWDGYIHHSAPLATPGVLLVVQGGEIVAPLRLRPLADAEDIGTVRVAWNVLGQAQEALRGQDESTRD